MEFLVCFISNTEQYRIQTSISKKISIILLSLSYIAVCCNLNCSVKSNYRYTNWAVKENNKVCRNASRMKVYKLSILLTKSWWVMKWSSALICTRERVVGCSRFSRGWQLTWTSKTHIWPKQARLQNTQTEVKLSSVIIKLLIYQANKLFTVHTMLAIYRHLLGSQRRPLNSKELTF